MLWSGFVPFPCLRCHGILSCQPMPNKVFENSHFISVDQRALKLLSFEVPTRYTLLKILLSGTRNCRAGH